jgi:hypothetical protein
LIRKNLIEMKKLFIIGGITMILSGIAGWIYGCKIAEKMHKEECYQESMMEPNNCK